MFCVVLVVQYRCAFVGAVGSDVLDSGGREDGIKNNPLPKKRVMLVDFKRSSSYLPALFRPVGCSTFKNVFHHIFRLPGFIGPNPSTTLDKRFNFEFRDYYILKESDLSTVFLKRGKCEREFDGQLKRVEPTVWGKLTQILI